MSVEFLCSCCQAATAGAALGASGKALAGGDSMAMQLGHVHIKTREDPRKVAQFYIDNFGATVKREIPGRGCQLDLHGVQLNVPTMIADQNHEQHVGIWLRRAAPLCDAAVAGKAFRSGRAAIRYIEAVQR